MNTFKATNHSEATVSAEREEIWAVLTDPELLAQLTPYVQSIDTDGDRWCWNLSRIPVLSAAITPSFTVKMEFDEPGRIDFSPAPGTNPEQAAASGIYLLELVDGGTHLTVDLSIEVDLPLPRAARRPASAAMSLVMGSMGKKFSANLLRHLGTN